MEKKVITFEDALDSLNRIDLMMDDFLLNLEGWNDVKDKGSLLFFLIEDYERNINGDESIGVYGLEDVVRFIVNECNRPLANKLFSIGVKNTKADELIKSFQEFWNPSFQFLGTLSELYFKIDSVNNKILFAKEGVGIQDTNQSEIVPETENGNNNTGEKSELMSKAQVMMNIKNEPFEPRKNGKPIPYQKCYERLTEGKIRRSVGESEPVEVINKLYDFETFKHCVDRADLKNIMVEGKKCFCYLFLRCISEYFENPFEYRKAAAKAFGIKTVSSVGGRTKMDFFILFSGIFKDEDIPRKKRK